MKKRWIAFCMVLLLVIQAAVPVQAAGKSNKTISGISAYCMDNQLCTFVKMGSAYDGTSMKVTAFSGNETISREAAPVLLKKSSAIVRYLLMIDLSGSMREYIGEINSFVKSLINAEKRQAVFTVATFGERFTVVKENQTDENAVIKVLSELEYNEKLTNPYTGIENALNYLDSCSRRSGDIVNLILISDGEPDLGYTDTAKEKAAERKAAKKAVKKIAATPETVVHTLLVSGKDSDAFTPFKKGTGLDQTVRDVKSGKKAGRKVAAFVDNLYTVTFPMQEMPSKDKIPVGLQFMGNLVNGKVAMMNVSWDLVPLISGFSTGGEEQGKGSDIGSQDEKPTESPDDGSEGGKSEGDIPSSDSSSDNNNIMVKGLIAGGCGIAAILIVLLCVLLVRRKKRGVSTKKPDVTEDAVYMKLEILSGQCKTSERTLYLADQLIIGSASDCDLVWGEKDVSKHNSRIYRKEQMIYIEDLNSKNGTLLNGMRLHVPSRLRSGDEITIGAARFMFRF